MYFVRTKRASTKTTPRPSSQMNVTLEWKRFNLTQHTIAHHEDAAITTHIPPSQQTENKTLNKYRYQKTHKNIVVIYIYYSSKTEHQKLVDPHKKDKQNCY